MSCCKHKEEKDMRKRIKDNVSLVGHIDWELESFHGDDYSKISSATGIWY